jgi:hypothetical protein
LTTAGVAALTTAQVGVLTSCKRPPDHGAGGRLTTTQVSKLSCGGIAG